MIAKSRTPPETWCTGKKHAQKTEMMGVKLRDLEMLDEQVDHSGENRIIKSSESLSHLERKNK